MPTRVIIIGGGVAGLSAAHELIRRNFEVDVYDAEDLPGGKARSMPGPTFSGLLPPLPAEHGFRFFPGFYKHLIRTMEETPDFTPGRTVAQNLVNLPSITIASFDNPPIKLPTRFTFRSLIKTLLKTFADVGVVFQPAEVRFYGERIWQILTSCRERRIGEYEKIGWWEYCGAESRSLNYKRFLVNLPRLLVAADPQRVSTKTNGDIVVQLYLDVVRKKDNDRVLNGPTNDVWIYPWLHDLLTRGVRYYLNAKVTEVAPLGGRVHHIHVAPAAGGSIKKVTSCTVNGPVTQNVATAPFDTGGPQDYYIGAVPVECMRDLLHDGVTWRPLANADPSLKRIVPLSQNVEWMNGLMFYLKPGKVPLEGHTVYADPFRVNPGDPQYAVTGIFQGQYWSGVDLTQRADGSVGDVLSVDISDWTDLKKGVLLKDIPQKIWQVVEKSLQTLPNPLNSTDVVGTFLDPAIGEKIVGGTVELTNKTPLLVNLVDTWHLRPQAYTSIPNLMLASDYVRTTTDLATMEGANEAARRAVNSILERENLSGYAKLWPLHEPRIFAVARWIDKRRYNQGLPWKDSLPWFWRIADAVWRFIGGIFT